MNPLQDRLRTFVGTLGISVQEFERKCGIKAGTASRMTENSYSTTFHKIQTSFPELNMGWLKTGEGEMLNPTPNIDIDLSINQSGGGNAAFGNITNTNDAKAQISLLQERIKSLELLLKSKDNEIAEKDARISELNASLDRERKMNDFLMGQNEYQ